VGDDDETEKKFDDFPESDVSCKEAAQDERRLLGGVDQTRLRAVRLYYTAEVRPNKNVTLFCWEIQDSFLKLTTKEGTFL
jgi:hypothetical protein